MSLATIRRMAADLMGVGENRIRMKPDELVSIKTAITRKDVLNLIDQKNIYAIPVQGRRKKDPYRRRGRGRRRGRSTIDEKQEWMKKVRSQRKYLVELVGTEAIDKKFKRPLYQKIKSGIFKNKKAILAYITENKMIVEKK